MYFPLRIIICNIVYFLYLFYLSSIRARTLVLGSILLPQHLENTKLYNLTRYAEWANRANFALLVLGCMFLMWNLWVHGAVILRWGQSMTYCYQYSQDKPKVYMFITDSIDIPPRCLTPATFPPSFPGCFHVLLQLSSSPEIFPKSVVAFHPKT